MIEHFDLPLGNKEAKDDAMSAFSAGFASSRLEEGKLGFYEAVETKSREDLVKAFPDYKDNQNAYDAMLGIDNIKFLNVLSPSKDILDIHRKKYTNALDDNIFELDENNNLIEGSGYNLFADVLFDRDTFKGFLLAQKNGMNDDMIQAKYQEIVKSRQKEISEAEESFWLNMGGALTGYLASQETLSDFASPGKIMASSVAKGFVKAMGVEASYVAAGEIMREEKRRNHASFMEEQKSIWDSVQEILINSGFAGLIRGIGSAVWDAKTMKDIHKRIGQFANESDALTDKQIFKQFAERENFRLHTNSNAHYRVLDEAEFQIEQGKQVDVAEALDIPIESKLKTEDTVNFIDELDNDTNVQLDKEFQADINKQVDEAMENLDYFDEDLIKQYQADERLLNDKDFNLLNKEIKELQNQLDSGSNKKTQSIKEEILLPTSRDINVLNNTIKNQTGIDIKQEIDNLVGEIK